MSIRTAVVTRKFALFLSVIVALVGLGMFLDGRVLDKWHSGSLPLDPQKLHSSTQDLQSDIRPEFVTTDIAHQIQSAVDQEKRQESEQSVSQQLRIESAQRRISDARRIAESSGAVLIPQTGGARRQSLQRDIESLKARLSELE